MVEEGKNYLARVQEGDLNEVIAFLDKHPPDQHNSYNKSLQEAAVKIALENDELEIYKLLVSRGVGVELNGFVKSMTFQTKRKLNKIHRNHTKGSSISKLLAISSLAHDTPESEKKSYFETIYKMYGDLEVIEGINPILQLISMQPNLKIMFDFKRDSVEMMDPTKNDLTIGSTNFEENYFVSIGAKELLDPTRKPYFVYGVITHELTHVAMMLLYNNNCKPYFEGDLETEETFERVVGTCLDKRGIEEYIDNVFIYAKDLWHIELIVRVPHLIARYQSDSKKLFQIKSDFTELFSFYENATFKDLSREPLLLEAKKDLKDSSPTVLQLQRMNVSVKPEDFQLNFNLIEIFGSVRNSVLLLETNCISITLKAMYDLIKWKEKLETFAFIDFKAFDSEKEFELIKKFNQICSKPVLIVDCNDVGIDEMSETLLKLAKENVVSRMIFVTGKHLSLKSERMDVKVKKIFHVWSHLTEESRNKLLKTRVNFQGQKVRLDELISSEALTKYENFIPLDELLKNREATIVDRLRSYEEDDGTVFVNRELQLVNGEEEEEVSHDDSTLKTESSNVFSGQNASLDLWMNNNVVVISDIAGAGKSTFLKMFANELKTSNPLNWIMFVDLKEFCRLYEKNEKFTTEFSGREEIKDFFSSKIMKMGQIESIVFSNMFNTDKVTFLVDGFDEISPSYKHFVLRLLAGLVRETDNKLWITTRPHLSQELKHELKACEFRLKPFNHEEQIKFLQEAFHRRTLLESSIETLIKNFQSLTILNNPLAMNIYASTFDDFDLKAPSLFKFYDNFVKNMMRRTFIEKGPEPMKVIINTSVLHLIEIHQKIALELVLKSIVPETLIQSCFKDEVSKINPEEIIRFGLVKFSDESSETFNFVHETFGEYFVAKFIAKAIFDRDLKANVLEILSIILQTHEKFINVKALLNDMLNDAQTLKGAVLSPQIRISGEIMLSELVQQGFYHLLTFACCHMENCFNSWTEKSHNTCNLLSLAVKYQSEDFLEKMISLAHKLKFHIIEIMFLNYSEESEDILQDAIAKPGLKEFCFLINIISKSADEKQFKDFSITKRVWKAMKSTLGTRIDLEKVIETIRKNFNVEKVKEIITFKDSRNLTMLDNAFEKCLRFTDMKFFLPANKHERDLIRAQNEFKVLIELHELIIGGKSEAFFNLKSKVFKFNADATLKEVVIGSSVYVPSPDITADENYLLILLQLGEPLFNICETVNKFFKLKFDENHQNLRLFRKLWVIIAEQETQLIRSEKKSVKIFEHDQFAVLQSIKSFETLFISAMLGIKERKTFELFLFNFHKEFTEEFNDEAKAVILTPNKYGATLAMFAALRSSAEIIEYFFHFIANNFSRTDFHEILAKRNDFGHSILHYAIKNEDSLMFTNVWSFVVRYFSENELKIILLANDSNHKTFIDFLHSNVSGELKDNVMLLLKSFLSEDELLYYAEEVESATKRIRLDEIHITNLT